MRSFGLVRPCELGAVSGELVVVAAADRAAATYAVWGRTPLPAYCGHLPFQGRLCTGSLQKAPSTEGTVSRRLTEDKLLKPDFMLFIFSSDLALSTPVTLYADRKKANGTRHWLSFYPVFPKRRKSAAALSAAVDTTNSQEIAPTLQAEPPPQKQPTPTPAALREGARGRNFSQRSCLPRNPRIVPYVSLREGVRGRVLLYREALSPRKTSHPTLMRFLAGGASS